MNIKLKSARGEPASATATTLTLDAEPTGEELEAMRQEELRKQEQRRQELEAQELVRLQAAKLQR